MQFIPELNETSSYLPEALRTVCFIVAELIGYLSIIIIFIGVAVSVAHFAHSAWRKGEFTHAGIDHVRVGLGHYLLLALEFLIAKDIIITIFDRSLEDVASLGGLIVIRVILSYFLDRELKEIKKKQI